MALTSLEEFIEYVFNKYKKEHSKMKRKDDGNYFVREKDIKKYIQQEIKKVLSLMFLEMVIIVAIIVGVVVYYV